MTKERRAVDLRLLRRLESPLSLPSRIAIAVVAAGLCFLLAWFGTALPIEVLLLAVIAVAASLAGFPLGLATAVLAAIADTLARNQHGQAGIPPGAILLLLGGIVVSVLFQGEITAIDDPSDLDPGQLAFRGGNRLSLPRGDAMVAFQTSLASLAAGIREVSQGDFTKNIAVSDAALQDLAIALNKLIFGMRRSLGQLHGDAGQLGAAGGELQGTAATALAVIEGAAVAQGQLDEGIQEQSQHRR